MDRLQYVGGELVAPVPGPEASKDPRPQLTVISHVYHQVPGEQATQVRLPPFCCGLSSDEETYSRRCRASEEWQPLDLGWIEDPGMVVIANHPPYYQMVPTEEERAAAEAKALEVSYGGQAYFYYVPPGDSVRLWPSHPSEMRVRCRSGETKYTLTVYPK